MYKWKGIGTSAGYGECRFPNDKVGHIHADVLRRMHHNVPVFDNWRAFFDGNYIGVGKTAEEAQVLVETFYEERYGIGPGDHPNEVG